MTETKKTPREPLPRGFWIIWSTVALDMIGFGMVAPILGRYADRFGATGFQVGMLFASFSLAQMIFAPVLGRWSDRIGRKPVIVISLLGTAVGSLLLVQPVHCGCYLRADSSTEHRVQVSRLHKVR